MRELKGENERLMELGNEARAEATNARMLLASAPPAPSGLSVVSPCTGQPHEQRAWLPPPAQRAPPHCNSAPACAWPRQWPWELPPPGWLHPDGLGYDDASSQPGPGRNADVDRQVEVAAEQQDDVEGQHAALSGKHVQHRASTARSVARGSTLARRVLMPAVASSGAVLQPSQALADLQIDGSGRAPVLASPAAQEAARRGGQKLQTANRGARAQARAQRETLRCPQQQRRPLRRVRNWNDTLDA